MMKEIEGVIVVDLIAKETENHKMQEEEEEGVDHTLILQEANLLAIVGIHPQAPQGHQDELEKNYRK
jgi:hypothetical protein